MVRYELIIARDLLPGVQQVGDVGGVVVYRTSVPLLTESHGGGDEVDGSNTWVGGDEPFANLEQGRSEGAARDLPHLHSREQDPGASFHQEPLSSFGDRDGVGEALVLQMVSQGDHYIRLEAGELLDYLSPGPQERVLVPGGDGVGQPGRPG